MWLPNIQLFSSCVWPDQSSSLKLGHPKAWYTGLSSEDIVANHGTERIHVGVHVGGTIGKQTENENENPKRGGLYVTTCFWLPCVHLHGQLSNAVYRMMCAILQQTRCKTGAAVQHTLVQAALLQLNRAVFRSRWCHCNPWMSLLTDPSPQKHTTAWQRGLDVD